MAFSNPHRISRHNAHDQPGASTRKRNDARRIAMSQTRELIETGILF